MNNINLIMFQALVNCSYISLVVTEHYYIILFTGDTDVRSKLPDNATFKKIGKFLICLTAYYVWAISKHFGCHSVIHSLPSLP